MQARRSLQGSTGEEDSIPKRRKAGLVTVTQADGSTEVVRQGEFDKRQYKARGPRASAAAYRRYRRGSHWRNLRRRVLNRDGHRCVVCGIDVRLEVHHKTYERIGAEPMDDLETLCQPCHAKRHR